MAQETPRVWRTNCPNCDAPMEITAVEEPDPEQHPLRGVEETLHWRGEIECRNCGSRVEIAFRAQQDHPFDEET